MALSSKIQGGALLLGLPKSIYYKLLCEFTAIRQKSWKKSYNLRWKVVDTMHLTKIKVEAFQTAISGKKEWNRKKVKNSLWEILITETRIYGLLNI